ncbi:SDR family oxidoreductase [Actinomycetota bacterium]|nr:SDR family oxidoreductase [Actinomycetota bacterium]
MSKQTITADPDPELDLVVITGASGHLGQAIVQRYLEESDLRVIAVGRARSDKSAELENSWSQISSAFTYLYFDELQAKNQSVSDTLVERFPKSRISVLINNGASQALGALSEFTTEQWNSMLTESFLSIVELTQELIDQMGAGSSIVNISSVEASVAFPNHGAYASAKGALEAYTRSLANEYGRYGIRANVVEPGLIEREGLAQAWPQGYAAWKHTSPTGGPVLAEQVANVAHFLGSKGSLGINGVVIPVDGGWLSSARMSL